MSPVVHGVAKRRFCSKHRKGKALPPTAKCREAAETPEVHERRRVRMMGEANPMWKGGDSDRERRNSKYKAWRIAVFERDDFTCLECGYRNGDGTRRRDPNAHHIVPWIESIELRYAIENGMTLCVPCHIKEHEDKD